MLKSFSLLFRAGAQLAKSNRHLSAAQTSAIADAEAMLGQFEDKLTWSNEVEAARGEIEGALTREDLVGRLAAAGCGPAMGTTPEAVMERLKAKSAARPSV